eukprot:Skav221810  [mRNA]  locus=scaffold2435:150008:164231:- [translate_table: standard]
MSDSWRAEFLAQEGTVDADAARAVLLMELIDYASKRGTVRAVQDLVAKALAEVLTELDDPKNTDTALELLTQLFREEAASRHRTGHHSLGCKKSRCISLIEQHGEEHADELIGIVEAFEDSAAGSAGGESAHLGIAVFLGALSKHLGADHVKVMPPLMKQNKARKGKKEGIGARQERKWEHLTFEDFGRPLMDWHQEKAAETLDELLETALAPKTDAVKRRGAAMGAAAEDGKSNCDPEMVKEAAREAINKVGSIISSGLASDIAATAATSCPEIKAIAPQLISAMTDGAQSPGSREGLPAYPPGNEGKICRYEAKRRATSAKAFGTLANALPEDMLGDVLPWLFEMLRSPGSAVERSGAAHGSSMFVAKLEVLMAKGPDRIEMLPEAEPEAREGYTGLFCYLPVAMGSIFEPYIEEVITTLFKGMSDDTASVRDTALKAAQTITKHFGSSHTALLLPPLEEGVFDGDWRIRHGAVQLMGQLIQQILRAHRIPTNSAELMQVEALPRENSVVKQACSQVWKAVVQNTPRTLRELLPTLVTRLIVTSAANRRDLLDASHRRGDLVSKLGVETMAGSGGARDLLAAYLDQLIPAIQQAIIDDDESVRSQAGTAGPSARLTWPYCLVFGHWCAL